MNRLFDQEVSRSCVFSCILCWTTWTLKCYFTAFGHFVCHNHYEHIGTVPILSVLFYLLGKKRRLSDMIDERFVSMSTSLDNKLAERDGKHFAMAANMAAKVLKLEEEVRRQAGGITRLTKDVEQGEIEQERQRAEIDRLKKDVEQGEKEQERQRAEISKLRQSSSSMRVRLIDHSRKIQALASEAVGFLDLSDEQDNWLFYTRTYISNKSSPHSFSIWIQTAFHC